MISPNLITFYDGWTEKADNININIPNPPLKDIYDKFITLFIIYDNLYNQASILKKDDMRATNGVVNYLGAADLLNELNANSNSVDIQDIEKCIEDLRYYIKWDRKGKRWDRDYDLTILRDLSSSINENKTIAILKVIYYVRCNLFHGDKQFDEYQRPLLERLIRILSTVNKMLFKKMCDELDNS